MACERSEEVLKTRDAGRPGQQTETAWRRTNREAGRKSLTVDVLLRGADQKSCHQEPKRN